MKGYNWELPPTPLTRKQHQLTVLGIGTTGIRVIDHLYQMCIKDTRFVVCHADKSQLWASPVPTKLLYEAEPDYEDAEQNLTEDLETALNSSEVTIIVTDLNDFVDCHLAESAIRVFTKLDEFSLVAVGLPAVTDPLLREQVDQTMITLQRQAHSLLVYEQGQMESQQRVWQLAEAILSVTEFCQGFVDEDFDVLHKLIKSPGRISTTTGKGMGDDRVHKAVDQVSAQLIEQSFERSLTQTLMLTVLVSSYSPILIREHTELMKQLLKLIDTEPAVVKQGCITDFRLDEWLAINVLLWMPYAIDQLAPERSKGFPAARGML